MLPGPSLKLSTGCAGSLAFQEVQAKVTQHELQNHMQIAAAFADLGSFWERQVVNQGQLQLVPSLEPLSKRYGVC